MGVWCRRSENVVSLGFRRCSPRRTRPREEQEFQLVSTKAHVHFELDGPCSKEPRRRPLCWKSSFAASGAVKVFWRYSPSGQPVTYVNCRYGLEPTLVGVVVVALRVEGSLLCPHPTRAGRLASLALYLIHACATLVCNACCIVFVHCRLCLAGSWDDQ